MSATRSFDDCFGCKTTRRKCQGGYGSVHMYPGAAGCQVTVLIPQHGLGATKVQHDSQQWCRGIFRLRKTIIRERRHRHSTMGFSSLAVNNIFILTRMTLALFIILLCPLSYCGPSITTQDTVVCWGGDEMSHTKVLLSQLAVCRQQIILRTSYRCCC